MSLQTKVGSFLTGTGIVGATVPVTGVGFTPKVILFYWTGRTEAVDTVGRRDDNQGWGVAVSTSSRVAINSFSDDAVAAADTSVRIDDTGCVTTLTSAAAVDGVLNFQSFDADGFTLVVTNQFAVSYRIHFWALGGSDLTGIKLGTFNEPAAIGNQPTTGIGFQPQCLFVWGTNLGAPPTTFPDSRMCFGIASSANAANQGVWAGGSNDAAATSQTMAYCKSGEIVAMFETTVTSLNARASLASFDTDGFTLNWSERASTRTMFYLALRGGNYLVDSLLTQTDTVTPIVESGFGFQPTGGMFISANRSESAADTPTDHDQLSIGAFDSISSRSAGGHLDRDNVTPTQVTTAIEFDEVYLQISTASAIVGLMDVQSVDAGGFTCIMDDADPSQAFVFFLAVGSAAGASTALTGIGASNAALVGAGASETLYYLFVNDANGNRLAVIQDYSVIECARVVNGVGMLSFIVSSDTYPLSTFKVDGLVELWRAGKGGNARLEFEQLWFIRERYKLISQGVRQWRIVAYDLNYMLGNPNAKAGRIVAYSTDFMASAASLTDAKAEKQGAADDMLKQVARENMASSVTDTSRDLTSYFFSVQANTTLGAIVKAQMARRNLLKLFQQLCEASTTAGVYLAWDILCVVPPNSGTAISLKLNTYALQRGIDHRLSSNQPVLVGPDFDNLEDIELGFINTDEANFIYAGGKGEEAIRPTTTASDVTRINVSPYNRREQWLDASNVDGLSALQDAADAALRAGRPLVTLSGRFIDTDQARYGIHWNFGDYVTAQVDGYSFDCRLDAVSLKFTRDAGEEIAVKIRSESVGV